MKKFLLLACTGDRPELLDACLISIKEHLSDWELVLVGQGFGTTQRMRYRQSMPDAHMIFFDKLMGMHNAKVQGLKLIASIDPEHVVVSIDDDMQFIPQTHLSKMAEYARLPDYGLVSGNWVRSEKQIPAKIDKMSEKIIFQHVVYTGGGLAFSEKITQIILGLGEADFISDNAEWSLATFLAGYRNARYMGSLAIHRIMSKGGRRAYVANERRRLPDEQYMLHVRSKEQGPNAYHIGQSSDLTEAAHAMHKQNLKSKP